MSIDTLINTEALREYLIETLGDAGTMKINRIEDGDSNETFYLTWGELELVLRRPPNDETADTAHDVTREFRVMEALRDSDVPVPRTVAGCKDESIIGSEFFLMERVAGEVIRLEEPSRFRDPRNRLDLGRNLLDTLAAIHDVDYEAVGLGTFGSPDGFIQRQLNRWQAQIEWALERTGRRDQLPFLETVETWLEEHCPTENDTTLLHGDFKLNNVIVNNGTPPHIEAVLDWEMSTLGDPLTDLAWLLLFWHDDPDDSPVLPEIMPAFTAREGYPSRADLIERYKTTTGRSVDTLEFYYVLSVYKSMGISEMFHARELVDDQPDPIYPEMKARVPELLSYAQNVIDGDRHWGP
jgi:aminoglycoside phosphotransferase (APT) family kinase protein